MRRRLLLAVLLLLLVVSAAGAKPRPRGAYCSPSGDSCEQTYRTRGVRHLSLRTFSFRGRVRLCVTPPRGDGGCRYFRLQARRRGIYAADVRWRRHFAFHGRGLYRVSFSQPPAIHFPPISFVY
jgi:hypothetical protein